MLQDELGIEMNGGIMLEQLK